MAEPATLKLGGTMEKELKSAGNPKNAAIHTIKKML
jgi:hypothetical protein